jgi:hypothetical protein
MSCLASSLVRHAELSCATDRPTVEAAALYVRTKGCIVTVIRSFRLLLTKQKTRKDKESSWGNEGAPSSLPVESGEGFHNPHEPLPTCRLDPVQRPQDDGIWKCWPIAISRQTSQIPEGFFCFQILPLDGASSRVYTSWYALMDSTINNSNSNYILTLLDT